jgi:hypothetical protein
MSRAHVPDMMSVWPKSNVRGECPTDVGMANPSVQMKKISLFCELLESRRYSVRPVELWINSPWSNSTGAIAGLTIAHRAEVRAVGTHQCWFSAIWQ